VNGLEQFAAPLCLLEQYRNEPVQLLIVEMLDGVGQVLWQDVPPLLRRGLRCPWRWRWLSGPRRREQIGGLLAEAIVSHADEHAVTGFRKQPEAAIVLQGTMNGPVKDSRGYRQTAGGPKGWPSGLIRRLTLAPGPAPCPGRLGPLCPSCPLFRALPRR
jgi:hypothetical protein